MSRYSGGISGLGTILDPNALPLLSVGARGPLVASLQLQLHQWGQNPGPADGIFGPKTEAALKGIQKVLRVPLTGRVDAGTIAAMRVDLGSRGSVLRDLETQFAGRPPPSPAASTPSAQVVNSTAVASESVTTYDGEGGGTQIPWVAVGVGLFVTALGFILFKPD